MPIMSPLALFETVLNDPFVLAPFLVAISVAMVTTAILWPLLERRSRKLRFQHVYAAERRMRDRASASREERSRDEVTHLRHAKPQKIYQRIVEALKLQKLLKNPKMRALIYQAGYRGPAAAMKFAALRVLIGASLAVLTAIYLPLVLALDLPFPALILAIIVAAAVGWCAPTIYLQNRLSKRQVEVRRNWPDAMDLMLICVESGMSIEAAFRKIAEELAGQSAVLSEELALTTAELNYLQDRQQAYRRFAARVEVDEVKSIITSLIQAEKHGTPIGQALRVLSRESRALRMQAAEKKAAALPPKLTVPMIVFFLPVLFAVIMTPAIIQILRG